MYRHDRQADFIPDSSWQLYGAIIVYTTTVFGKYQLLPGTVH
jgi:hypothetical protein